MAHETNPPRVQPSFFNPNPHLIVSDSFEPEYPTRPGHAYQTIKHMGEQVA
ncbi:MAG: hypothetical protein PVS3B1_32530 [Ktedonobacteraceae bacterium]